MVRALPIALCALLSLAPGSAPAATLTATFAVDVDLSHLNWTGASAGETAFVIEFDDTMGGTTGILEGEEFLSFDWINNPYTGTVGLSAGVESRTLLHIMPTIAGVSEGFAIYAVFNPLVTNIVFREAPASATASFLAPSTFTFAFTGLTTDPDPDPSPVPLPAALPMLGAALAGLFAIRRRNRLAA